MSVPKTLKAVEDVLSGRLAEGAAVVTSLNNAKCNGYYVYETATYKWLCTVETCNTSSCITQKAVKITKSNATYSLLSRVSINRGSTWSDWVPYTQVMSASTSAVGGIAGYAPAPSAGDQNKFLRGDATWQATHPLLKKYTSLTNPLKDYAEYRLTNVSTLNLTYPTGDFECWIRFNTPASGTITITFPNDTRYLTGVPDWSNGTTYEISIKDKIAVICEVESA